MTGTWVCWDGYGRKVLGKGTDARWTVPTLRLIQSWKLTEQVHYKNMAREGEGLGEGAHTHWEDFFLRLHYTIVKIY